MQINDVLAEKIENLSKGYKKRVEIASALLHEPKLLILDEPTDGLDPNQKHDIREFMKQYARNNTVLVSTHVLEDADMANRVIMLSHGRLVRDTDIETFKKVSRNRDISEAFRIISEAAKTETAETISKNTPQTRLPLSVNQQREKMKQFLTQFNKEFRANFNGFSAYIIIAAYYILSLFPPCISAIIFAGIGDYERLLHHAAGHFNFSYSGDNHAYLGGRGQKRDVGIAANPAHRLFQTCTCQIFCRIRLFLPDGGNVIILFLFPTSFLSLIPV